VSSGFVARVRGYRELVRRLGVAAFSSLVLLQIGVGTDAAGAARAQTLLGSPLLWATVDQCTSAPGADVVGLRGSMPGTGRRAERMLMRFRLEYRGQKGNWHFLKGADSGFVDAGSARYVSRQAGRDFHFASMPASQTVLRGVVTFDWRLGAMTIHHARLHTTGEREVGAGAVPPGYSAAHCALS
jgi:hypothetical protein